MKHQMTDRQLQVLRYLVEEYVDSGKPVGSRTLIENFPLDVSSATVRNEMASLERAGYVEHPHRSAGRVPTDLGFRHYVERYAVQSRLSPSEQIMISHQFRQAENQLEGWLQMAASTLAEVAGNLSLVTSPRNRNARLRHFELLSLQPRIGLLILVTQDSSVTQSLIHLEEEVSQGTLSEVSRVLNDKTQNFNASEIYQQMEQHSGLERFVLEQLYDTLTANDRGQRAEVWHEGIEYMVQQPEFSAGPEINQIFGLIRGGALLSLLLPQVKQSSEVQIFIGRENRADELQSYGVVLASYGVDHEVTGLLAIVGPRRMEYERSISSVRYVSELMSDLMSDLYYPE